MPWLAFIVLGWGCGRNPYDGTIARPAQWYANAGVILLVVFAVIRGLNGYGNKLHYRDNLTVRQWLHEK